MGGSKTIVPDSITVYSVTAGNTGYKTFVKAGIHSIVKKGQQVYTQQKEDHRAEYTQELLHALQFNVIG
jgi:hypothetical protein